MVRFIDMEMIIMKEEVYTYRFVGTGGIAHHTGPLWGIPGSVRRQNKQRKNMGQSLYWVFEGRNW